MEYVNPGETLELFVLTIRIVKSKGTLAYTYLRSHANNPIRIGKSRRALAYFELK
jgi:hypothetical protein